LEFPAGWGVLVDQKISRCIKLNWNFQRGGGGVLEKIPSVGEVHVWIFSGTTQYIYVWLYKHDNTV